ncbi:hypothetical protein B0H11DRAFT_2081122, partial [Mycena galericulata]
RGARFLAISPILKLPISAVMIQLIVTTGCRIASFLISSMRPPVERHSPKPMSRTFQRVFLLFLHIAPEDHPDEADVLGYHESRTAGCRNHIDHQGSIYFEQI